MSFSYPALAFLNLSSGDIILVMFFCLLMFGSKKLPELSKAFGQSLREFKKAASEVEDNFRTAVQEEERKKITDTERQKIADEERRKIAEEERQKILAASTSANPPTTPAAH
jgi:sec-independent protein translocase protein TatA